MILQIQTKARRYKKQILDIYVWNSNKKLFIIIVNHILYIPLDATNEYCTVNKQVKVIVMKNINLRMVRDNFKQILLL